MAIQFVRGAEQAVEFTGNVFPRDRGGFGRVVKRREDVLRLQVVRVAVGLYAQRANASMTAVRMTAQTVLFSLGLPIIDMSPSSVMTMSLLGVNGDVWSERGRQIEPWFNRDVPRTWPFSLRLWQRVFSIQALDFAFGLHEPSAERPQAAGPR